MKTKENLKKFIDIIIPEIFFESRNSFYRLLENSYDNPNSIIDTTNLLNGFWGLKDYKSEDFQILIILDAFTEGFIQRYKSNETDELWGKLSVVLNCRNLQHLRKLIDFEIYENKTINYTFLNSSLIFKDTEFKVIEIIKNDFSALTILNTKELNELKKLELGITINELNKNVA